MRSLISSILILFMLGCNSQPEETTTRGNLHIFIPESLAPIMIDEVNEFLSLYNQYGAHITYDVVSADTAAQRFVHDTARIAFLPRPLTWTEREHVKQISPDLNELIIAYDGITAVVNIKNKTENMTTTNLRKILTGSITRWEQLGSTNPTRGIIKVFYQDSSDVVEYLRQRLLKQNDTYTNISARITRTSSDLQTLQSVEKDPMSLGFVGLSWIDSMQKKVKIVNLGRTKEDTDTTIILPPEADGKFFSPNPAYIFLNYYPLKRAIYMYTRTHADLAAGFSTYVATAEGQKLFLKRGLLPGTQKIKLKGY
jgi:phosphate transport system substrate-binding protein